MPRFRKQFTSKQKLKVILFRSTLYNTEGYNHESTLFNTVITKRQFGFSLSISNLSTIMRNLVSIDSFKLKLVILGLMDSKRFI